MRLLCAYDRNEDAFAIVSHNLSDADAQEQLKEMREEKIPVYALNQPRAHNSMDPDDCPICARLVLQTLKPNVDRHSEKDQTARRRAAQERRARRKQVG